MIQMYCSHASTWNTEIHSDRSKLLVCWVAVWRSDHTMWLYTSGGVPGRLHCSQTGPFPRSSQHTWGNIPWGLAGQQTTTQLTRNTTLYFAILLAGRNRKQEKETGKHATRPSQIAPIVWSLPGSLPSFFALLSSSLPGYLVHFPDRDEVV